MAADPQSLEALAEEVGREARSLTSFLKDNSYYVPSFDQAGWKEYPELPPHVQDSRRRLQEAAKAVHDLAAGPTEYLKALSWSYLDISTLRWLVHFRIPEAIPLHGSISYQQLAETCSVDESHLRRILHYTMTNRLFHSPQPDCVAHSTYSAPLITDPTTRVFVDFLSDETFPASAKLVEAHEKWPDSEEEAHSAYSLAYGTDMPMFEYIAQPGFEARAESFGLLMASFNAMPGNEIKYTVEGYDWSKISRLVDVGGGNGATAVALAQAYPHLKVVVEDQAHAVAEGRRSLPDLMQGRVNFIEHDFYGPQPEDRDVKVAQAFMLRMILHDHSDKYAKRIVKQLLPVFEKGAKLIVVDAVVPAAGTLPPGEERALRCIDMEMMQTFNSKERGLDDWKELFAGASRKLSIVGVWKPEGSKMSIMEVELGS